MKREFQQSDYVRLSKPYKDEFEYGKVDEYDAEKQICTLFVINNGDKIDMPTDELEYLPPVVLTEQLLKKLIRYEYTFQDYLKAAIVDGNWEGESIYEFTLDDMIAAVDNMLKKNPDKEEFCDWADLIGNGLEDYFENSEDAQYDKRRTLMGYAYPASDGTMANCIYEALVSGSYYYGIRNDPVPECGGVFISRRSYYDDIKNDPAPVDLPLIKEDIQNYRQNKPMREYMWSSANKLNALKFTDDDNLRSLSAEEIDILRGLLLELSMKDNPTAIRRLGYCYYGGNKIFPCNWQKSRDCFIKLMRMDNVSDTDKCQYANSLGYIYYYGRCTGGKPEYEKAYRCFTLGAAGGLYESMYKLADMYQNGYCVPVNKHAALTLVSMVYNQNYDLIRQGEYECQFADSALRMGNLSRDDGKLGTAYYYYTLADFAIRKRLKYDRYGDEKVFAAVQKELAHIRQKYPLENETLLTLTAVPLVLINLLDNSACRFTVNMTQDGLKITAARLPKYGQRKPVPVFECMPEYGFCRLTDNMSFIAHIAGEPPLEMGASKSFIADCIDMRSGKGGVEYILLHYGEKAFTFTTRECIYNLPIGSRDKTQYTFASVVFVQGGREYDYICDLADVQPGDSVIVEANGERQTVTVTRVYRMAMSDMPLEVASYKKILEKAGE